METPIYKLAFVPPFDGDDCEKLAHYKAWLNARGDFEFEYEPGHVLDDLEGVPDEDIEYAINIMELMLGDEATAENQSMWCDHMFWYAFVAYLLVAIIATLQFIRGVHTAFVWCTISTLVMFNVLLKMCDWVKLYLPCIVGGMAWEGFMFWGNERRALENKYEATLAVVYRDYHRNDKGDITYEPLDFTVDKTFEYEHWIFPFWAIFYAPGIILLIWACACQVTGFKHVVRNSNQFKCNYNVRYLIIFCAPIVWICTSFFLRDT